MLEPSEPNTRSSLADPDTFACRDDELASFDVSGHPATPERATPAETFDVVVIGAGQAGLSVGYHLAHRGIRFVILDAHPRVGDSWRNRWDSLRLFSPARYAGLDGLPFPGRGTAFPPKDDVADYLESYAAHFSLPVRGNVKVDAVKRFGARYAVTAGERRYLASHVVVAMSGYQHPWLPAFAQDLDDGIVQLHSADYRNPAQLRPGPVLIVGAGNSGADIALELARAGHSVVVSGRDTGHIPFRIEGLLARHVLVHVVLRLVFHRILTLRTPLGRKARVGALSKGGPLVRVKPEDLAGAGVGRVGRVAGVQHGLPVLEDGRVLDVANLVWCTGFRTDFSWIQPEVFDAEGRPVHERGVVTDEPGLYFVGLPFLYAMSSTMIHGVGRDARYIVEKIRARLSR